MLPRLRLYKGIGFTWQFIISLLIICHLMILDILGFQLWAKRHTARHAGGFSSAVHLANLTNLMLCKLNFRGQERVDSYSLLWCLLPSCNVLIPAS